MGRMKRRRGSTPHPTLSPVEAERVAAENENAPKGAANFFAHVCAVYAQVSVLQRLNLSPWVDSE